MGAYGKLCMRKETENVRKNELEKNAIWRDLNPCGNIPTIPT